ncbi:hypothetical protein VspSTUT16_24960 [Vibrio sp. STUT-A16]|nr:hypothetical protein VspSTUT16_24960 [Vibrio sp. STUT-A16]
MNIYLTLPHVYISCKKVESPIHKFEAQKKTSLEAGSYKLNSLEENYSHSIVAGGLPEMS